MKAAKDMRDALSAQRGVTETNKPDRVPHDLTQYLERLESEGELVRIKESVEPRNFELSSMVQLMEDGPNKAILFENVKGHDIPVVANLYGSIHRVALALGIEPSAEQIEQYKDDPRGSPGAMAGMSGRKFNGFAMDARSRAELVLIKELLLEADRRAHARECPYEIVDSGGCQDVVLTEDIDVMKMLPVVWHLQQDASAYITPAGLVQKDPENGILNIGVRRHMVCPERYGPKRIGVQIGTQTPGGKILQKWHERGEPCPMALVIGSDPATAILSTYSSPHYWMEPPYSEFDMTGVMRGKPLELVKCKTIDLEVPANAQIVIEGLCPPPPDNKIDEGPMMEFTDYSGTVVEAIPFMEITAITYRRNPIYHTTMSGNSEEHRVGCIWSFFGYEQMALTLVKRQFPHVQDIGIMAGSHGFHAVVSLKKTYEGEDLQLLHHLLATQYFKYVTVVDDDIDPHNSEQVEWAKACRAGRSPDDFLVFDHLPTWEMDPEIDKHWRVAKLGVLATRPFGETYEVPAPDRAMMDKMRPLFEKYVKPC
ncbi:MAG: UbiD family decarboxylase [Gammaproteobacteria bacterium]|nr:UbiD family decarboxylase [Gammaproteobacteria bacterium]